MRSVFSALTLEISDRLNLKVFNNLIVVVVVVHHFGPRQPAAGRAVLMSVILIVAYCIVTEVPYEDGEG